MAISIRSKPGFFGATVTGTYQKNKPLVPPFKGAAPVNTTTQMTQQMQPGVYRNNINGQAQRSVTGAAPRRRFNLGSNPQQLQQQQQRLQQRIDLGKAKNPNRLQNRLDRVNTALGQPSLPDDAGGVAPNVGDQITVPPGEQPSDIINNPDDPTIENPDSFRGVRDFETDFQEDPVFKSALKTGQTELGRLLASRGLANSGAEIEANSDLLGNLTTGLGRDYLDIAREDAGRYDNQRENEANRLERREDAQWNRFQNINDSLLGQNPMQYLYRGTEGYNDIIGKRGDAKAKRRADKYKRIQGPAGGGGGASVGPFIPPYPSAPYTGDIDLARRLGQGSGQQDYLNQIISLGGNLLGSLF